MWLDVLMIRMRITELRKNLSKALRAVKGGETVEVRDRDRPIARIVPILNSKPHIRQPTRPFAGVRDKRYPPSAITYDVVDALLEDRRKR